MSLCETNRYFSAICASEYFWKDKLLRDYNRIDRDPEQSWKNTYRFSRLPLNRGNVGFVTVQGRYGQFPLTLADDHTFFDRFRLDITSNRQFFNGDMKWVLFPSVSGKKYISNLIMDDRGRLHFVLPNGITGMLRSSAIDWNPEIWLDNPSPRVWLKFVQQTTDPNFTPELQTRMSRILSNDLNKNLDAEILPLDENEAETIRTVARMILRWLDTPMIQ